jgi:hypothetical protein
MQLERRLIEAVGCHGRSYHTAKYHPNIILLSIYSGGQAVLTQAHLTAFYSAGQYLTLPFNSNAPG